MADETNGTETPTADDLMREVTGLCDDAKVTAFIHCVVDLAIANDMNLLRLCDMHNIPVATNIATAEVLIHGLERGDLDWRNIVNPI